MSLFHSFIELLSILMTSFLLQKNCKQTKICYFYSLIILYRLQILILIDRETARFLWGMILKLILLQISIELIKMVDYYFI